MIQELIKTVAQSQQIQSSTQREFKGKKLPFNLLVYVVLPPFPSVDHLSV